MSRYKNFSVWGSGVPGASTLTRLTPRLRHAILTETTQDLLFRNLPILQQMMRDHRQGTPFQLFGNSVKFILVIAHGYIVNTTICPRNMGIFHMADNEARGKIVPDKAITPILYTTLGMGGDRFSTFLERKLGGEGTHTENEKIIIDSVAYSTYGPDRMPAYYLLKAGDEAKDPVNNVVGVFDITTSLENRTFNPYDFQSRVDDRTPDQRRPGIYKELTPLTKLLQRSSSHQYHPSGAVFHRGTSLDSLCRALKDPAFSHSQGVRYDNGLCFMFVICCTEMDPTFSSNTKSAVASAFPAYTSYSVPPVER